MELVIARQVIKRTPAKWKNQYFDQNNGRWGGTLDHPDGGTETIYKALKALDLTTCSAKDVSAIIGNDSWSHHFCSECCSYVERAIEFDNHGDSSIVCEPCVRQALELLTSTSTSGQEPK